MTRGYRYAIVAAIVGLILFMLLLPFARPYMSHEFYWGAGGNLALVLFPIAAVLGYLFGSRQ